MTTQPTVNALETKGIARSVINLASASGSQQWLGGIYPRRACSLVRTGWRRTRQSSRRWSTPWSQRCIGSTPTVQRKSPRRCAGLCVKRADDQDSYINALAQDKGQFLPDGMMPASGPGTALAVDKLAGNVTAPVNIATTYTNSYALTANKLEGFMK